MIDTLNKTIDFTFSAGRKKFISVAGKKSYWTSSSDGSFSKKDLKTAIRFLITECHFTIGQSTFSQIIGIPMGIDPAPFWANLFLHHFENEYMTKLLRSDVAKARCYHGTYRFIDDLCAINNNNVFSEAHHLIYPPELELKLEHQGDRATFLDLDISISENTFIYKLFDKRDAFPFTIVRMPYFTSNIPSFIFYGSFKSEILRIAKNTLNYNDFLPPVMNLLKRMIKQGGNVFKLKKCICNVSTKHNHFFSSFQVSTEKLLFDLTTS